MKVFKVVVIGAGISGLSFVNFSKNNNDILIIEKSKKLGGRCSTRKTPNGFFNHGAQYFTARSFFFKSFLKKTENNQIEDINSKIRRLTKNGEYKIISDEKRYIMKQYMRKIITLFSVNKILKSTKAYKVLKKKNYWIVFCENEKTNFVVRCKYLVFSIPIDQVRFINRNRQIIRNTSLKMFPCWALMVFFKEDINLEFNGIQIDSKKSSILSWVMKNKNMSGEKGSKLVLHGNPIWSKDNINEDESYILKTMLAEFKKIFNLNFHPSSILIHKWMYASGSVNLKKKFIQDDKMNFFCIGDWIAGGRIEGAFLSGLHLAKHFNKKKRDL